MRVLQINSVCGIGSTGRIATDLHKALLEQGHESYIAFGRDLPRNCDQPIRIGNQFDFYQHIMLTRLLDKHGFGSKRATTAFIEKVKELNPDIIHLHNIHGYYLNIEILFDYLRSAKKPVLWTLHDCWSFTGHCAHFSYVGCEKWRTGCHDCPQKKEYPRSIMTDNSRMNYQKKKELFTGVKDMTLITPSEWLAGLVRASYLQEYPVQVIHNGIDLNVFKPTAGPFRERHGLTGKCLILAVASKWNERKGYNHYIELAKQLTENEVIVMVGISEKQRKMLPGNVIGIRRTANAQELAEIYTAADVFVNYTLEDNFPTVNLESLACGTPVVTFNSGGSPETIDSLTGDVVQNNNISESLAMIRRITQDDHSCALSRNCLLRAENLFSVRQSYAKIMALYLQQIARGTEL